MKKIVTLTIALLVCGASLAAADGLYFLNNGCGADLGTTATATVTWTCTSNTGNAFQAVGSVILPQNVPHFITAGMEVLVSTEDASPIPAWWTNTCRSGAFVEFFDPGSYPVSSSCPDIWSAGGGFANAPLGVANVYEPGEQTLFSGIIVPANAVVVTGGGALAGEDQQNLVADGSTELAVFETRVTKAKTLGACSAGCTTPVTMALTGIWLGQPTPTPDILCRPSPGNSTCIGAQGSAGSGLNCAGVVPTHNRTWGQVKALYR